MWTLELAIAGAKMAERRNELSVTVELHDARVSKGRRMALGDEDVAVGRDRHRRGPIEHIQARAALARLAERHQHAAVGREFGDLVALAVSGLDIDQPEISVRIGHHLVWKDEHT